MKHGAALLQWILMGILTCCAFAGAWGETEKGFSIVEHPGLDFPAGRCGGHAPTGVGWTAPEDAVVTVRCAAWRLRMGPPTQVSLWVKGVKLVDRAGVRGTSSAPVSAAEWMTGQGSDPNALRGISLRAGDEVVVQIDGNDFVGLDLSIESPARTWDLAKDFSDEHNPSGPWTYGTTSVDAKGAAHITPYDMRAADFDPADFEKHGQNAWYGKDTPWFCSLMKSTGKSGVRPEVLYTTGRTVYLEGLVDGSWVGRYWSVDGRLNVAYERVEEPAFSLTIDGQALTDGWQFVAVTEAPAQAGAKHVVVELVHRGSSIGLKLHTLLDDTPVLTRWLEISNQGTKAVAITEVCPWTSWLAAGASFWGEASPPRYYDHPFTLGCFTKSRHCWEGWFDWKPVPTGETVLGCDKGQCFDEPFFVVRNEGTGEYLIGDLAWSANWRMNIDCEAGDLSVMRFGIGPWASAALRVVPAGEAASTPAVHMGRVAGDLDSAVQAMHEHVRRSVLPARDPARSYRIQYAVPGDQGYLSPNFGNPAGCTEKALMENVDLAEALGAELFIMDAWWWDRQGDWSASKERFPQGLEPLAAYVHGKGMLFGLYGEIEKASPGSRVAIEHPEWLEWLKPWPILDLAQPEPAAWMESQLTSLAERYKLDLYRLDYNIPSDVPLEGAAMTREGIAENRWWRYYEAFGGIFRRFHAQHPEVVLQQAACGGGRNDLGTTGLFHESYLTDGLRVPYEIQNYSGQTLHLPPEILVIAHGADAGGGLGHVENFETYLRVTYTLGTPWIFAGMTAPSVRELSAERRERFLHYGKLYKEFIRPLLPTCRVYHHAPVDARGGVESSGWFAMEFASPARDQAWATVVRIGSRDGDTYLFRPRGLSPSNTYQLTVDSTGDSLTMDGIQLMRDGLPVRLESVGQSELITIRTKGVAARSTAKDIPMPIPLN